MTVSPADLAFYAFGILLLWATPGPVWVALLARSMSGGFASAWPLAVGVSLGDVIWPFLAILGVSWVLSVYGDFLHVLRYVAALTFIVMGWLVIRSADKAIGSDSSLTKPGRLAGFLAGVACIVGNPKAILFYMGMLPGFFDIRHVNGWDIAAICAISAVIPMLGNLLLALSIDRARALLRSPSAVRRMNLSAGCLLIGVGLVLPFV